jgi:hypothetical protein
VPPAVPFLYYMRSGRFLLIFPLNLDLSRGFLYTSLISPEGTAKLRWAAGEIIYFRVHRSSFRVLGRSEGCSVTPKGAA